MTPGEVIQLVESGPVTEIVLRIQLEYQQPPAPRSAAGEMDQPLLYKVSETARLLAVGESVVHELIARGELESVKIGASRRVTRAGIEAYMRRIARGDVDAPGPAPPGPGDHLTECRRPA